MTRNGKIARLPYSIRDLLNRRLHDGEPGNSLVEWLNGLPKVREILEDEFGGRSISEQNLSEWKQGGFEDWLRHQETREWVQKAEDDRAMAQLARRGQKPLHDPVCSTASRAPRNTSRRYCRNWA